MFNQHHHRFSELQEATLNRLIVNQTLLACALRNYITAVQVGDSIMILAAEEEAIRALQMVGGPAVAVTEPAVSPV